MYVIQITDVVDIIYKFGLQCIVDGFDMLAYYQLSDTICIIIRVHSKNDKDYIIKMLKGNNKHKQKENLQACFSEYMRKNGMKIPKKYNVSNGDFCTCINLCEETFLVTVEEYFGKDIDTINTYTAGFLGSQIAMMHNISRECKYSIGNGSTYKAIMNNNATFDKIWNNVKQLEDNIDYINLLQQTHNYSLQTIRELWGYLPKATVHGDLSLINNLVCNKNELGIIDFNNAGDEVLIGDLLITWYSSIYDFRFVNLVSKNELPNIKKAFFENYLSVRKPTVDEIKIFDKLSNFLNGVYFTRFVVDLFNRGYYICAKSLVDSIYMHYNRNDTPFDLSSMIMS